MICSCIHFVARDYLPCLVWFSLDALFEVDLQWFTCRGFLGVVLCDLCGLWLFTVFIVVTVCTVW